MIKIISAIRRFFCGLNANEKKRLLIFISNKPSRAIEIAEGVGFYRDEAYYLLAELEMEGLLVSWQDESYKILERRGNRSKLYGLTLQGKQLADRL